MAKPKVFLVHLRRPKKTDPEEQRDDPFYEFGSFGCTGCHGSNLLNPRHADELEGARLGFIQGGQLGSRLVFLTPPVSVVLGKDHCEAQWKPATKPFKYRHAPVIADNERDSDFSLLEAFARNSNCPTVESGLSSRFRTRAKPLPIELAREVIAVYQQMYDVAPKASFAKSYDEALPYKPPKIDRNRKETYQRLARKLKDSLADSPKPKSKPSSRCGVSRLRKSPRQTGRRS